MNSPVRISFLGFGGMAHYHYGRLSKLPQYKVVGSFDTDEKVQEETEALNIKTYASAQELFADAQTEAVLIATPNDWHLPYAVAAAQAGKHIICEKPAAITSADFDKMQAASERGGVVFTVHQNRRWDADYLTVKNIIESGVIGSVYKIESFVCGANGIPGGWRKTEAAGGGMMLDWGVHLLDQIFCLINSRPVSLYCTYSHVLGFEVDDGFSANIAFENGINVTARVDTNTYVKIPRWIIYGRDGTAIIRDWDLNGEIITPVYGSNVEITGIKAGNGFTKTMAYRPHESVRTSPLPSVNADFDAFYKNFAAAVRGEQKPAVSLPSVRKVIRIMELCKQSAKQNGVITDELKDI